MNSAKNGEAVSRGSQFLFVLGINLAAYAKNDDVFTAPRLVSTVLNRPHSFRKSTDCAIERS